MSYRANHRSDRDVVLSFLAEKVRDLLALNVAQNRTLRETGLTVRDLVGHLLSVEDSP
jgi:hypothetical protein